MASKEDVEALYWAYEEESRAKGAVDRAGTSLAEAQKELERAVSEQLRASIALSEKQARRQQLEARLGVKS